MKKNKKIISESHIINKYLKKLNFNKKESFNFSNDGGFLKSKINKDIVVTNDGIVEGVDFYKNDSPESIAQKIITYNLSDLSSMGAMPYCYTLSLSLSSYIDNLWLNRFSKALFYLQNKYNFFLLGGDIGKSKQLNISASFYGYVKKNLIIKRDKSKIGDSVWVSGNIGQSYIGLLLKQKKICINKNFENYFIKKYLFPEPCMLGKAIINLVNSCIDISDGFIGDLSKLLTSKIGVDLFIDDIPFSKNTKKLIERKIIKTSSLLNAGDDYEIIFTSSPKNDAKILQIASKNRTKITKVGRIIDKKGIFVECKKYNIINDSFQYYF